MTGKFGIVGPICGEGQSDRELKVVLKGKNCSYDVRDHGEAEHEALDANEQGSPPEPHQQQQLHERRDCEKVGLERKPDSCEQTYADRIDLP